MIDRCSPNDPDWLERIVRGVRTDGVSVLDDVLEDEMVERLIAACYRSQELSVELVGAEKLKNAGELGVVRIPMLFSLEFFHLLAVDEILQVAETLLGPTCILHLQNAFLLPPSSPGDEKKFQHTFHRDFPRCLNGYFASLNVLITLTPFTEETGATWFIQGSQQKDDEDPPESAGAVRADAKAGAVVFFDSTTWHKAGRNVSGIDRLGINHQFTRSFFKPQIDYSRALEEKMAGGGLPEATQRLLGWHTRVPMSHDEYYRPTEDRLYRSGQG
jgi:ectoine hydroxylase-related dioxygenase (phytanoyl-CoA dioxygenase family)